MGEAFAIGAQSGPLAVGHDEGSRLVRDELAGTSALVGAEYYDP